MVRYGVPRCNMHPPTASNIQALTSRSQHVGVVPDLSLTGSSSGLQAASDSMYDHTFGAFDPLDMQAQIIPACINPYFASYDQDLLSHAFTKRGLYGQDQSAPSHFIPTSSYNGHMSVVPVTQVVPERPSSASSYTCPKDILHVGDDQPMAREARVAR